MNFSIEQREVELESTFSPRLWSLVHDVPVLYEALLERLAPVGLSGMDLRPEAGNGSVGGAGLGFWLFGNKVNVQIRLDSFRFRTSSLGTGVLDSVDGVVAAIRTVTCPTNFASGPTQSRTPAMDSLRERMRLNSLRQFVHRHTRH